MSFSSGTFSLTAGNPVVTATTISSTVMNNTLSDIATGLSTCILKDGTQTCTAAIPFAEGITIPTGKSITGAGTAKIDAFSIGSVTPGAGVFTTLTASGNVVSKLTDGGYVNHWIGSQSPGTTLTTGQSFNITCDNGKFFVVSLSSGEACVFHASYTSTTITLVANPDGTGVFVGSSTPGAGIIGISKSANSHDVNIKNGAGGATRVVQFCALGGTISAASAPA